MTLQTFACQSGSNGNCIFVQAGRTRLLIDAGISGRLAAARLAEQGQALGQVDALLLSHEHVDHVRGAGVLQRRHGMPIYASEGTARALSGARLGRLGEVRTFRAGQALRLGEVEVQTLATPHDDAEGVCFVVQHEGARLGVLTDLGHRFAALAGLLPSLDAAYLESNHDVGLLRSGGYPERLQRRIAGPGGHLSNDDAAALLRDHAGPRLRWVALCHLSGRNNTPQLALATARRAVGRGLPLHLAGREAGSAVLRL